MQGIFAKSALQIDARAVQHFTQRAGERFEGVDFSPSGRLLAVASADTNFVWLFRRLPNGRFDDTPRRIDGLKYPHDVSLAMCGDIEMLAVAQREGAVAIFAKRPTDKDYELAFAIKGTDSKLEFSDGVAFVPPHHDSLAACNLLRGTICFYPRVCAAPLQFASSPDFELTHASLQQPDGLAFSHDGALLATANHGANSVSIFRRDEESLAAGHLRYGLEPAAVIQDPNLNCPHSLAFTQDSRHLVVTNAGANFFSVYQAPVGSEPWPVKPALQQTVGDETRFQEVNSQNRMEGGPKGIAIRKNELAVCSPEFGLKIYKLRQRLLPTLHVQHAPAGVQQTRAL